jgi:hypothetical protein
LLTQIQNLDRLDRHQFTRTATNRIDTLPISGSKIRIRIEQILIRSLELPP